MTVYTSILSDCERFELCDLIINSKYLKEPYLTFYDDKFPKKELDCWDSSEYLLKMFKDLKDRTESEQTKDLKTQLEYINYNYLECKEILVSMYKEAVKLGMF